MLSATVGSGVCFGISFGGVCGVGLAMGTAILSIGLVCICAGGSFI